MKQVNQKLLEALLTLRDMHNGPYQMCSDEEMMQRTIRWLDALVPPGGYLPEDERS